ncbi:hypothetical protein RJ641_005197 [Dillenia turbinata]|uniref:SET domain-containing protein n=1 Tax=Dillenia turbinata TaxID=194707 RepID=A0AAN8VKD7_9MAGN
MLTSRIWTNYVFLTNDLNFSFNRLGRNADEADAEKIVERAVETRSFKWMNLVQENIHFQVETFCKSMDEILLPKANVSNKRPKSTSQMDSAPRRSGGSFAVGKSGGPSAKPCWTLELKPSEIPHKDAGQGLFINGEVDAGAVVAFYPARELWDGSTIGQMKPDVTKDVEKGSDGTSKILRKPLEPELGIHGEVLELRNPLAFGHFANHPPEGMIPNVMAFPYDFPLYEKDMRAYIPNLFFGDLRVKLITSKHASTFHVLNTVVLVATRALSNEELLLNYRFSDTLRAT